MNNKTHILTPVVKYLYSMGYSKQKIVRICEVQEKIISDIFETEKLQNSNNQKLVDIHRCMMPTGDCFRLWIGQDQTKYVDSTYDLFHDALEKWVNKYGNIIEDDWKYIFPSKAKRMFLEMIMKKGYSMDEANEIIQYLPMTEFGDDSKIVDNMIQLWKDGTEINTPENIDETYDSKLKIVMADWRHFEKEPESPRLNELLTEYRMILFRKLVKNNHIRIEDALEIMRVSEEDREEYLTFFMDGEKTLRLPD